MSYEGRRLPLVRNKSILRFPWGLGRRLLPPHRLAVTDYVLPMCASGYCNE